MRFLIAGLAAVVALALAAPSFAQQEDPAAAPVPATKPKPGTAAYCQTLKSASSRSACTKKLHAQATPKATKAAKATKTTTKTTSKKTKKTTTPAAKPPEVGQLMPPPPAAAPAPAVPTGGTVAVPPLPQKTI